MQIQEKILVAQMQVSMILCNQGADYGVVYARELDLTMNAHADERDAFICSVCVSGISHSKARNSVILKHTRNLVDFSAAAG
jgi:hypothetical protein